MPLPSNIDDQKQYDLQVNTVVKVSDQVHLIPGLPIQVKGKVLKTLPPAAVVSAVEVK